jgi:hypothetical protein
MRHWSFHYFFSLGIAISNTIILIAVFRFKTQDGMCLSFRYVPDTHPWIPECLIEIGLAATEKGTSSDSTFRQILSHKTVHLLAFFIFVYVGVEVTLGGLQCLGLDTNLTLNIDYRLDCNLHCQRTKRRSIIWLHLYRLFRWYVVLLIVHIYVSKIFT